MPRFMVEFPGRGRVTYLARFRLFSIFFILFIFTDFETVSDFQFLVIDPCSQLNI